MTNQETRNALIELRNSKATLEADILRAVSNLIAEFEASTSVFVQSVDVDFSDVTSLGDERQVLIISGVTVGLEKI